MKKRKWYKKKRIWTIIGILFLVYISTLSYHQFKAVPNGVSYNGQAYNLTEDDIDFLYDLTYQKNGQEHHDQEIFDEVYSAIENAEKFLIVDMFMINESASSTRDFPKLSQELSQKIIEQKEKHPDLKVVFITDPINTTYFSHEAKHVQPLKEAGVEVVYTDLEQLRDPNPLYSTFYRIGFQWFGQNGNGWIMNPFGEELPNVTARSYLKLFNIKANHRKVIVTENEGFIISANAHDASGYHSNIGFKVKGDILKDIIESEKAVIEFSGGDLLNFPSDEDIAQIESNEENGEIKAKVVTEDQIETSALEAINLANKDDQIWLGMYYLADRDVIDAIKEAADRGVQLNLILDPNQNAFGNEKTGLPNLPIAQELLKHNDEQINLKWYNVKEEQYHSKILFVKTTNQSLILGGSANLTSRNIDNYNLESNLYVSAPNDSELVQNIEDYFERIWQNQDARYTVDYDEYSGALTTAKRALYYVQKITLFTTY